MEGSTDEAASSTLSSNLSSISCRCTKSSPLDSSSSYHIVFCAWGSSPSECYIIKVPEDRPSLGEKPRMLSPFWAGRFEIPDAYAALGSQLYFVGAGRGTSRDLWILDVTRPDEGWKSGPPMLCPRYSDCPTFVQDGKVFVFGGLDCDPHNPSPIWGEFFDPERQSWNALPSPPAPIDERGIICVPLEDSKTILFASPVLDEGNWRSFYIFYTYNVATHLWATLEPEPPKRFVHFMCPPKNAVAAGNTLYWIKDYKHWATLLAYDLDRGMWLQGRVNDREFSDFEEEYIKSEYDFGCLVHLGNQRFCTLLQYHYSECGPLFQYRSECESNTYLYRVVIDVSHDFDKKKLTISVVSAQKYKIRCTIIGGCRLL